MRKENELQEKVISFFKEKKIWHFRYTASTTYGIPDILALHKGVFIGIELKREDKKGVATLLQKEVIASIKKNGGFAAIVDNLDDVVELINDLDNKVAPNEKWHSMLYEFDA